MAKTHVFNTAPGPRGVILSDGTTHFLDPNEGAELDLHEKHDLYEGVVKGDAAKKAAKAAEKADEAAAENEAPAAE